MLEELGYFCGSVPIIIQNDFYSVPYDIKVLIALYVHSLISQHPRADWFTDGEKIWYLGGPEYTFSGAENEVVSVISEYIITKIVNLSPQEEILYDKINGDLRLANFSGPFLQRKVNT